MRWAPAVLVVLSLGCGAGPAPTGARSLPPSDLDPMPYTPGPEPAGSTDRTVSLAAAGGEDQARQVLPMLLRAVRDADERQLVALLADEIAPMQTRPDLQARARAVRVQQIMSHARRPIIQADVQVESLVDLGAMQLARAGQWFRGRDLPDGIRATDIVVEITALRPEGRLALQTVFGWALRGHFIVRPGRDARIVGL